MYRVINTVVKTNNKSTGFSFKENSYYKRDVQIVHWKQLNSYDSR